jgi:hypothetical protein
MTGELRNKVTIYRSQTTQADQHFPRIEFARDSFGRHAHGTIVNDPPMTLHPGDQVVFECAGCDPLDHPLTWTMTVLPGGPTEVREGFQARFDWHLTEQNIGATSYAQLYLVSDRAWHRHDGYDDRVIFAYAVLPRRASSGS